MNMASVAAQSTDTEVILNSMDRENLKIVLNVVIPIVQIDD